MRTVYKPRLKDAAHKILFYLDYWFVRRRAFKYSPI